METKERNEYTAKIRSSVYADKGRESWKRLISNAKRSGASDAWVTRQLNWIFKYYSDLRNSK